MTKSRVVGRGEERHDRARRQTLGWAETAAAEGDYFSATRWLDTLEAVDGGLPPAYEAKRRRWLGLRHSSRSR